MLCIAGTRPEVIKLASVYKALQQHRRFRPVLLLSGQHPSAEMLARSDFDMAPDFVFRSGIPTDLRAGNALLRRRIEWIADRCNPRLILAQGDTSTALAAAQVAAAREVDLVHVEAGLRTHDLDHPWPEEAFRQFITRVTRFHCAPTPGAQQNLLREGVAAEDITVTGNTGVDALIYQMKHIAVDGAKDGDSASLAMTVGTNQRYLLVTSHRREWPPEEFDRWLVGLAQTARRYGLGVKIIAHPAPERARRLAGLVCALPEIEVLPPLGYRQMIRVLVGAFVVITDSGGLQEECPTIGKPLLVVRCASERVEGLVDPAGQMVGYCPDRLEKAVHRLVVDRSYYSRLCRLSRVFGDGQAAQRIVAFLDQSIGQARGISNDILRPQAIRLAN